MSEKLVYGIIYKATNTKNQKVYIGQTYRNKYQTSSQLLQTRKRRHITAINRGSSLPFHNALNKHVESCFEWTVLLCSSCRAELNYWEQYYIDLFNSLVDNNGYNCKNSGNDHTFSKATKDKMSQSAKDRWARDREKLIKLISQPKKSEAYRKECRARCSHLHTKSAKLSAKKAMVEVRSRPSYSVNLSKGKKRRWSRVSKEEKDLIMSRSIHSKESRSKAALTRSKTLELICTSTGNVVGEYIGSKFIAEEFGISVSGVRSVLSSKSKAKTICNKKYTVRYKSEKAKV